MIQLVQKVKTPLQPVPRFREVVAIVYTGGGRLVVVCGSI
jgi:hypothetical protein